MIKAAGILLLSTQGRILFLKRGSGSDYPGMWAFPGGRQEEGEDAIAAAIRETDEETGGFVATAKKLQLWTRRISPRETTGAAPTSLPAEAGSPQPIIATLKELATAPETPVAVLAGEEVDFTTFFLKDVEEFIPNIEKSGEHIAFAWAKPEDAPQPLHPGVHVALARFTMDELGVANAMIAGELTSPQRYGNFSLFKIRITGTGMAYRHRKMEGKKIIRDEEFVYRNPQDYINSEFLERCNGLLVVMEHPDVLAMNHEEFEKRTIGTVFKSFVADANGNSMPFDGATDVWGIAKIYDEDAIEVMTEQQLSTSPGVVWRDPGVNSMNKLDGVNFLLEGKPSLMDHIAVCFQGVWDKSGPPIGVQTADARKDSVDMEKAELEALLEKNKKETDTAIKGALTAIESLAGAVSKVVSRFDAEDKRADEQRKAAAKKKISGFTFSGWNAGEIPSAFFARHDAEEKELKEAHKDAGEEEEAAKDNAEKARRDAARARADNFKFSGRKDDEDDESCKKRNDAEEEQLRADMEEAGEEKEKAAAAAKDRRKRHDEESTKERKDYAGVRAENADLKKRLENMEKLFKERLPETAPKDEDPRAFAEVQSAFDEIFPLLGLKTPAPMAFEPLLNYRKRGAIELKKYSETYKDSDINVAAVDSSIFDPLFKTIMKEAAAMARTDAAVPEGQLLQHEVRLPSGAPAIEFRGKAGAWMRDFMPSGRLAEIQRHNALGKRH